MSRLRVFQADKPQNPLLTTTECDVIVRALGAHGAEFERVSTVANLGPQASADDVLRAYEPFITSQKNARGYKTADVVRIARGQTGTEAMRAKFLSEHIHSEDESRLFAEGSGAFYLHLSGQVFELICETGDYLRVPAGTKHWFDMGSKPFFTAVRLFTDPSGWVAQFTGNNIASRFPKFE